jgi:hypothetical protein
MNHTHDFSRRKFIQSSSVLAGALLFPTVGRSLDHNKNKGKLSVRKENNNYIIGAPAFELCLNTTKGLDAVWWLNKLTGRKLDMRNGSEIRFTIGLPYNTVKTSDLDIYNKPEPGEYLSDVEFELYDENFKAKVIVRYSWNGIHPVLIRRCALPMKDRRLDQVIGYSFG